MRGRSRVLGVRQGPSRMDVYDSRCIYMQVVCCISVAHCG